ncbi:reverse transcriptase domain-containing protein [Tanacetum coccineum]
METIMEMEATIPEAVVEGRRTLLKTLMKMMTEAYYPRSEIKKLETELWNLTVKGTDVERYTQRFQELVLLCSIMVPDETDKVERYVGGLLDSI